MDRQKFDNLGLDGLGSRLKEDLGCLLYPGKDWVPPRDGVTDIIIRGQVQRELKSIQRQTNKTFCFVTHDQDEALTMSDRIIVMNMGKVEQDGSPEELYFKPASRFVADFIGETNFLSGRLLGQENDVVRNTTTCRTRRRIKSTRRRFMARRRS